jgi:tetratricopeptide (TPR) repeat protein
VETKPVEENASPASVMAPPPVSENPPSNTTTNATPRTEEELIDDVQLAWENMELARKLFSQSEKEEDKRHLALCYGYCGEIRCESESFTEAIEDFINAAKLHEEIEGRSSRNAAGDYVMAGSSAAYNHQFGVAYEYYLEALTHSDNALRKLIGSEAPETVLETDETFLDPLSNDDIEEWLEENEGHENKEEVLELFECCKELTEKLDFLDSKEHEEVSNTDVTAMVQEMLQQELGGLLASAVGSEDLPINDLGVAKSAEPKKAKEEESKKPVAEEKVEEVKESKLEAKVSIESSAPTGVKRALEDATEEQPQKKQKIE